MTLLSMEGEFSTKKLFSDFQAKIVHNSAKTKAIFEIFLLVKDTKLVYITRCNEHQ